jgi:antitoxin Phd
MGNAWALQDAKNRLSELVDRAVQDGPQTITRHGREVAVVVSVGQFRRLAAPASKGDLVDFIHRSPLGKVGLETTREVDEGREIDL